MATSAGPRPVVDAAQHSVLPTLEFVNGTTGVRVVARGRMMGTDCALHVTGITPDAGAGLLEQGWALLSECNQRWSRFLADSELSELNAVAGAADIEVSPLTATLISAMRWAYDYSDHLVDATVLPELLAAGYDRDFAQLDARNPMGQPAAAEAAPRGAVPGGPRDADSPASHGRPVPSRGLEALRIDGRRVSRPAGIALDSGGVGKGLAADLLAETLRAAGAGGALVDLGGDIRAIGADEHGDPWRVGCADPVSGEPLDDEWRIEDAAVATSTTAKRRWGAGAHHLIDPRTGRPSESDLLQVSVVAATAVEAETAAKAALLLGSGPGRQWLAERGLGAILIRTDQLIDRLPGRAS